MLGPGGGLGGGLGSLRSDRGLLNRPPVVSLFVVVAEYFLNLQAESTAAAAAAAAQKDVALVAAVDK